MEARRVEVGWLSSSWTYWDRANLSIPPILLMVTEGSSSVLRRLV